MALHPCCQPASIGSRRVTHQPGDSVAELSGGTGRQCRGAVRRHWDSGAELFGTEAVRGGPDHRASPTLMAELQQLQQRDPVLGPQPGQPSPLTPRNAPHGRWSAEPSTVPEEWDPPSWAGWPTSWFPWTADSAQLTSARCPKRGQLREMHCGAML